MLNDFLSNIFYLNLIIVDKKDFSDIWEKQEDNERRADLAISNMARKMRNFYVEDAARW